MKRNPSANPEVMAMNVLGDEWLAYLDAHPPDSPFRTAWDAYKRGFFPWLWMECNEAPRIDGYGRTVPEGHELELFRRSLPRWAVYQSWYYWKRETIENICLRKSDAILREAMATKAKHPDRPIGDIVREIGQATGLE